MMQPDPTATAHPSTGDARDEGVRGVSMRAGTSRGYAVGYLRDVELGADVAEYLQRIEATLALFGGEWVIHGATPQPKEGAWPGDLVVIAFPTLALAEAWYASPEYQAILGLRRAHANSMVALVEGVPSGYQAVSTLQRLMTSPRREAPAVSRPSLPSDEAAPGCTYRPPAGRRGPPARLQHPPGGHLAEATRGTGTLGE